MKLKFGKFIVTLALFQGFLNCNNVNKGNKNILFSSYSKSLIPLVRNKAPQNYFNAFLYKQSFLSSSFSSALAKKMEGKPCTNHWDVIASYDEKKFNHILSEQYRVFCPSPDKVKFKIMFYLF